MPFEVLVPLAGLAVSAVARMIRLWLRLRYGRYVVDQAVAQGVPIDPVAVIEASIIDPDLGPTIGPRQQRTGGFARARAGRPRRRRSR